MFYVDLYTCMYFAFIVTEYFVYCMFCPFMVAPFSFDSYS